MDEISLQGFKEKLNIYFLKDNGEEIAEKGVEDFLKIAVEQNKDNNPFFYAELLSSIKARKLDLSELVNPNNTVVREVLKEATQKAIQVQEQIKINNEMINQQNNNQVEEGQTKISDERTTEERKNEVDNIIGKYKDFHEFIHKSTKEEYQKVIDYLSKEEVLDKADALLAEKYKDPDRQFTDEENRIIEESGRAEEFGFDLKEGKFSNPEEFEKYLEESKNFDDNIKKLLSSKGTIDSSEVELLLELPQFTTYKEHFPKDIDKYVENQNKKFKKEQERKDVGKGISEDGAKERGTVEVKIDDNEFSTVSQAQLENYFDLEFAAIEDPARDFANIELLEEKVQLKNNFIEITAEEPLKEEPVEVTQEQPGEPAYEAPTIEVEKKGLAKWFDKLKQSRNPLARLITGQLGKKKDNLLLNEANDKIYEDKPSTGRFDATDTALVPVGKGVRNSFIQAMEKLFKRTKGPKEPTQVMEPVTPKNAFDERYAVDTSSLGNNNIIVPENVNTKANNTKQAETPAKEDDGWSK